MARVVMPDGTTARRWAHAEFRGDRAVTAPLTWGQRAMWWTLDDFRSRNSWLNLCRTVAVPGRCPADVPAVANAIGALVSRHESLRTRVRPVGDELRQVAADAGRLPLLVIEAACGGTEDGLPDDDGAGLARRTGERLGDAPFDHAEEWPLRVALVLVAGRVRRIVLVFSHATVDFHSTETVLRDLRLLLVRGTVADPPGLQTIDVAQREAQAQRRRSARAIAYWTREFPCLPAGGFARGGPAHPPRYRRLTLVSEAVELATRMIAARHRVSTSTVLLAATAALTADSDSAALTADSDSGARTCSGTRTETGSGDAEVRRGPDRCGLVSMANNRFQPGYGDAIAKLNQLGLIVVDLADRPSFAQLLPRVGQAAMEGYRHAYYDPPAIRRAFADLGFDYLTMLGPYCLVNDIRLPRDPVGGGPDLDRWALEDARTRSTMVWSEPTTRFVWRCRLQLVDAPGAVGLVLTLDTCFLPPDRAVALLRDLEDLLVRAAFQDVPWPWRPPGEARTR
ncbi:condensation domain-containing protein [Micromonospora sp. NPDC050417]|uniref:condensation domain-containing protein n=1 Tax=Micromonospora sp. NPDC050417 TaxID=3364280 RepID=UPI0037AC4DF7